VRAVRIHADGGPEVLVLEDVPDPTAGPGEVLVRLRASALNHLDVWIRKGLPSVPKPRILGADGAGIVEALGEGVEGFEPGDRVVINPGVEAANGSIHVIGEHGDGTNAELIAVPATNVHPIPGGLSFEEAAAFPLVFETAYRMLVTRARLEPGEWVLLWGIGSGVSTAGLAIAKALGARTIVTSSSDAKLARATALGADVTVNHATGDVKAAVKEATDGHGADIVVDHVGEATWRTSLDVAAREGRIAVCGATSGPNPPAALHRVWWKQLTILGSTMGTRADFAGAYALIADGRARPVVDEVFPLDEIRAAHARLEAGEQLGKVVLAIQSELRAPPDGRARAGREGRAERGEQDDERAVGPPWVGVAMSSNRRTGRGTRECGGRESGGAADPTPRRRRLGGTPCREYPLTGVGHDRCDWRLTCPARFTKAAWSRRCGRRTAGTFSSMEEGHR
jgi:NADPH:quinone reductase-like Zn-dependent oxidoreductase